MTIISVICLTRKAYAVRHFLTICLASFDLLFGLCQVVNRKSGITIFQSVSHMAIHGSASCLILLVIYRTIFIIRRRRRIRCGAYTAVPSWTILFYIAPVMDIMLMNVFYNYTCGHVDFKNQDNLLMTFITSYMIPWVFYLSSLMLVNRTILHSPRSQVLFVRYKIAVTTLTGVRMILYLLLWLPTYVSLCFINSITLALSLFSQILAFSDWFITNRDLFNTLDAVVQVSTQMTTVINPILFFIFSKPTSNFFMKVS